MQVSLSPDEMLERWRIFRDLEPLRADSVVDRTDGLDIDSALRWQMRAWYLDLLDHADPVRLAPVDVANRSTLHPEADGSAVIILPENCRRLISIMVDGWDLPAKLTTPDSSLAVLQLNPFTRGNCHAPVAVVDGLRCHIYPLPDVDAGILWAMAAVAPDDGSYLLDDSALALIAPQL
jgi:hypothetical protein